MPSTDQRPDHNAQDSEPGSLPLAERFLVLGGFLAVIALTTPVLKTVWAGDASLFGLPRSMLWVISVLLSVFALLLWSFLSGSAEKR